MKKKKQQEVSIPDLDGWLTIDDYGVIDLYKSILEKIKQALGTETIYVLWHDHKKQYQVFETTIDNIRMCYLDYDGIDLKFKNGYIYNIEKIYKDKETAQKEAKSLNIEFLENSIQEVQKQIDKINPVKLMEDAEKQRQELFEKYKQLKQQLEECKKEQPNNE